MDKSSVVDGVGEAAHKVRDFLSGVAHVLAAFVQYIHGIHIPGTTGSENPVVEKFQKIVKHVTIPHRYRIALMIAGVGASAALVTNVLEVLAVIVLMLTLGVASASAMTGSSRVKGLVVRVLTFLAHSAAGVGILLVFFENGVKGAAQSLQGWHLPRPTAAA